MSAVALKGSVGEKAKPGNKVFNDTEDVKAVQQLLNKVFGSMVVPVTGKCGFETIKAIKDFQALWDGIPDGSIWPAGMGEGTLKRLNRMAAPLTLNPISGGYIRHGGYRVSFKTADGGALPKKGFRVYLSVANDANLIDLTGRAVRNVGPDPEQPSVLQEDDLPSILKAIEAQKTWAPSVVPCRILVKYGINVISRSDPAQNLKAPVKPHSGKLGSELLKASNVGDWTYASNNVKGTDGRFLWMEPFNDSYYFAYGGQLETDPELRGLVCITYIGAVYGVGADESVKNDWKFKDKKGNELARVNVMSAYGTQLAVHLNAKKVDMEAKKAKEIKEFFKAHPTGHYMMWKEGHTVLVIDGKVHEFTNVNGIKKKGYRQSDAVNETAPTAEYGYGNDTWWIRELQAPPG